MAEVFEIGKIADISRRLPLHTVGGIIIEAHSNLQTEKGLIHVVSRKRAGCGRRYQRCFAHNPNTQECRVIRIARGVNLSGEPRLVVRPLTTNCGQCSNGNS